MGGAKGMRRLPFWTLFQADEITAKGGDFQIYLDIKAPRKRINQNCMES